MSRDPSKSRPLSNNVKRMMWLERASPRSGEVYKAKRAFTESDRLYCHKQGLLFMEAAAMGLKMEDFAPLYMKSQLAGVVDHYFCSSFQDESELARLLQMPVLVDNPKVIIETLYWIEDIISKTSKTDNKSLILSKAYQAESAQPPKALLELSGREVNDIDILSYAYWLGYMYRCECIMHDESSRMVYGAFDEKTMLTIFKEISDSPLNKENLSDCAVTICEMLDRLLIEKIWKNKHYKDCI